MPLCMFEMRWATTLTFKHTPTPPRPGGGIGRHAGLKILWLRGRAGSIPAPGTKLCFWQGFFNMYGICILFSDSHARIYISVNHMTDHRYYCRFGSI